MYFLRLISRNALRHKLRTGLTVLGLVVAFLSFGLLQSIVDAWYHGADAAAPNRLITRNAVSLTVPLPVHYRERVRAVEGVASVAAANWFAGVYQDPKNFFPQFAVEPRPYFAMYPEYRIPDEQFAPVLFGYAARQGHDAAFYFAMQDPVLVKVGPLWRFGIEKRAVP
ncbi:MAG: ABC transporter permease, partial [Burkholderiales bacterium]